MAQFVSSGQAVLAPNPSPERGNSVSFAASPDGDLIAYTSGYSVVLRSVTNPEQSQVYTECKRTATSVCFSPDGTLIAVGDSGGGCAVVEVSTLTTKKELLLLGAAIADIAFDNTGKRIVGCGDGKVNARCVLWESGSAQGEIAGSTKRLLSCSISPDGKHLVTASEDSKLRRYNGPPYKFSESFDSHTNFIQCCRYSPCGKYLASGGSDKKIYILDTATNNLVKELPMEHQGSVFSLSWSSDGERLMSSSGDKSVKLWDVESGKCISTVSIGRDVDDMQVGCAFAGEQAVSVSLSGDINYIDFDNSKISNVVSAHTGTPTSVVCDGQGGDVYVGGSDGNVYVYTKEGVACRFEGIKNPKPNDGLALCDGRLVSVAHDDTLRVADVSKGGMKFGGSSCGTGGTPNGVGIGSADSSLAAVVTENAVMLIKDGKVVDTRQTKYKCNCVGMSPDCSLVLVGGADKAVHIFEVSGKSLNATSTTLVTKNDGAASIGFSPNGLLVAVGESKDEVSVWDTNTFKPVIQGFWKYHSSKILCVSFSPDNKHIASCGTDGTILIWNVTNKMKKTKMERTHAMGVNSVSWIDENTVVSAGNDGCIRKWQPTLP